MCPFSFYSTFPIHSIPSSPLPYLYAKRRCSSPPQCRFPILFTTQYESIYSSLYPAYRHRSSLFSGKPNQATVPTSISSLVMAGPSKDSDDSDPFQDVFTKGPLEELITRCDIITAASLAGSSKHLLDSAKYSATLHASQPFGLPCVLHSHPTKKLWECNEYFEGKGTTCKLTLLDRFSSDAVFPNCIDKQWVGANGDWIATVGSECKWELVNMYTHQHVPLPQVNNFVPTNDPFTFMHNDRPILLRKIVICRAPIAAADYSDFSLVAMFDYSIATLDGDEYAWTVLENQFQCYFKYSDALIHKGLVFTATENGSVYVWNHLYFGPILLLSPPVTHLEEGNLDAIDDDKHEPGLWFLAISADESRLLLIHIVGVTDQEFYGGTYYGHGNPIVDHSVDRCGRTCGTYATGFGCKVYSKDTAYLYPPKPWIAIANLGACSLFLGLNYSINIVVGGVDVAPGYLTRSNCVYTSHHAIGLGYTPFPEICCFSLNTEEAAVGFSTNVAWKSPETPLWFIPSFANAHDWNQTTVNNCNTM